MAQSQSLPLPEAIPFAAAIKTERQDPVFTVNSFSAKTDDGDTRLYEQPVFSVGNKMVALRRHGVRNMPDRPENISIIIDNKEVGRISFWGSYPGLSGYPFQELADDPERLHVDAVTNSVVYERPYLTPDGSKALFQFRLRSLGSSQIELTWDVGEGQFANGKPLVVSPWFTMDGIYREHTIHFGATEVPIESVADLERSKISMAVSGDFHFMEGEPAGSYSIRMGGETGRVTQSLRKDYYKNNRFGWIYRGPSAPSGKWIIDLEEGAVAAEDRPQSVAGFDLWAIDGIHLPTPPVRNLMPNPSFEQGLRYWRWTHGGAHYKPGEGRHTEIADDALFGSHALRFNEKQLSASALRSFPMVLESGETYTFSFYAKAARAQELSVAFASAAQGGKFRGQHGVVFGDAGSPESQIKVTTEWRRYSRTFKADGAGLIVILRGRHNACIDGLQMEKGDTPSEFVASPVDGFFMSNDPDNYFYKGEAMETQMRLTGEAGQSAQMRLSVKNAYREILFNETYAVVLPESGVVTVPVELDAAELGEGVYVLRADYNVPGFNAYTDYYRFSILKPLSNTHATKDVFGTLTNHMRTIERGDDLGQRFMEWGFGSSSWVFAADESGFEVLAPMEKKYGINNYWTSALPWRGDYPKEIREYKHWMEVTPALEAALEAAAYEKVKKYDPERYYMWNMGNEEESSPLVRGGDFDEYFKAQLATYRGIKRANPNAWYAPTNGTSGYNRLRGYDAIEGYLKAAHDHGFKYDAIAVHPYGNGDKGSLTPNDLDEETQRLIDQMARYGYGEETPIFYTEMFNLPETYFPAWGAGPAYDIYQAGKLSYDFGNREYLQAATAARTWLIVLKYWPQVRTTNMWVNRPFVDNYLTPSLFAKAANTLGHHFPDVEYVVDIKPAAGMRGYSFKRKTDGRGVAAIWCVDHDVENGLTPGPVFEVKFGQAVEFYDFMGTRRQAQPDEAGIVHIPLTPAPLIIEADDAQALAQALQKGEVNDAKSALAIAFEPNLHGDVSAKIENLTGRPQAGKITVADQDLAYELAAESSDRLLVQHAETEPQFGRMYALDEVYTVQTTSGNDLTEAWDMHYFYVPRTEGIPNWDQIPAIEMSNHIISPNADIAPENATADDLNVRYKMAWDSGNLFLRVEVVDDHFVTSPQIWKKAQSENALWLHDGALEVYFDTGADGRTNAEKTFDDDDYRYDFAIAKDLQPGQATINRFRAVYHQLADGIHMPTKEEAAEKVLADFQVTETGYTYTITFAQRYIEPLALEAGFISGFALYLHDKDDGERGYCSKGMSLATEPGARCDYKPHLWPLMILSKQQH